MKHAGFSEFSEIDTTVAESYPTHGTGMKFEGRSKSFS